MSRDVFVRAILPIGMLFSGSLIMSNKAYLYLSVSYIQMLKVRKYNYLILHLILYWLDINPSSSLGLHSCSYSFDFVRVPHPRAQSSSGCNRLHDLWRCLACKLRGTQV
jgi:hypothetical protein